MPPTRQRIVRLLKRHSGLTISELSEMLQVSATAVRRHLKALEADGIACHRPEQRGAGRPSFVYELKSDGPNLFKQSYVSFVDTILQEIDKLDGEQPPQDVFDQHQAERRQHYLSVTEGDTLTDRVACLARIMETEGRMTTWQQTSDECFILREHNCPFHRFDGAFDYPCHREQSLLEKTLQADVRRVSHIRNGDVTCVYEISKQKNGPAMAVENRQSATRPNLAMAA
jgi:predicted ArsR family transcriptional regulator